MAEQKLYDRKLSGLTNFPDFLDKAIQDIRTASKAQLEIYFDSYFFGIKENEAQSDIQYKIGDFDHIIHKPGVLENELFAYNIGEFKDTMNSFIQHFIVAYNQSLYLDITARKLSTQN